MKTKELFVTDCVFCAKVTLIFALVVLLVALFATYIVPHPGIAAFGYVIATFAGMRALASYIASYFPPGEEE